LTENDCCSQQCFKYFNTTVVLKKRTKRASLNAEQSLQWLLDFIEENLEHNTVLWQVNRQSVCAKAFSFIHGYSLKKMYRARQIALNGAIVPVGVNKHGIDKGKKKLSVKIWITVYCEFFGDYRPDKKEIHLPCYMR